jgi:hypothetical protein
MLEAIMTEPTKAELLTERISRASASALAIIVLVGFLVPPLGRLFNVVTAYRFGAVGYVYYEIGQDRTLTTDGRFYLPRAGPATFDDLTMGDILQATDEQRLREGPSKQSPEIFELGARDCVIVLKKDHPINVQKAVSGGWLKVATSACGLFR